jgi:DNA mismatch repair protein MutL
MSQVLNTARIELLSPRLANQIAAGEVVERPASVIKELLENSLDSGAKRIDVDVEQGGVKLLRVRDDGSGISADDLPLALARHATSKIRNLEDLEQVMSLGFRGEALASISSVARLTLTSRTRDADQAGRWRPKAATWRLACSRRRIRSVPRWSARPVLQHPGAAQIPQDRKTEFDHLQEVIKRLALARFDVAFHLRHNGKTILSLHEAHDDAARARRVAAICGSGF